MNIPHRLPRKLNPVSYKLTLQPDLETLDFEGRVEIAVKCKEPVAEVVLNAKDLNVGSVSTYSYADCKYLTSVYFVYNEALVLNLDSPIKPSSDDEVSAVIQISFHGKHADSLTGFYRVQQSEVEGVKKYGVVCHFEPTGARFAFPCLDEPALRANFDISLSVPKGYVALSNMPEKSRIPFSGLKEPLDKDLELVIFETTPPMSTYLVCCIVGKYDYVEAITSDNVTLRVYTPVGKSEMGRFALDVAVKALDYYKEFFGVKYGLPKMDMIALEDLAIGAMENWGLLTFKEKYLLFDPQTSSKISQQQVTLIVAHEIAHQWFGNLVSINWWTHLWLKEGYATWIQHLCTDYLFPEWKIWNRFLTQSLHPAMELDSLKKSHPVEVEVSDPSEIKEIFDVISYEKGSFIIKMLYNWIGENAFREGMKNYLTRYSYKSAVTEDLWEELETASNLPVKRVMPTWTQQMGYPILEVKIVPNDVGAKIKIIQVPVSLTEGQTSFSTWAIPLELKNQRGETVYKDIMFEESLSININNFDPSSDWINFNPDCNGYFRVQYPPISEKFGLKDIVSLIDKRMLNSRERLSILNDQLYFVTCGKSSARDFITLLTHFSKENDYDVWCSISTCLQKLRMLFFDNPEGMILYDSWVQNFLSHEMKTVGLSPKTKEDYFVGLRRALLAGLLIRADDKNIIKACYKRLNDSKKQSSPIEPDIVASVYFAAIKYAPEETYKYLMDVLRQTSLEEEKYNIFSSIGRASDSTVLRQILSDTFVMNIRTHDFWSVLESMCKESAVGRDIVWNFFKENRDLFDEKYLGAPQIYIRVIKTILNYQGSLSAAEEVKAYFESNPAVFASRNIEQALEKISLLDCWRNRDLEPTVEFLRHKLQA